MTPKEKAKDLVDRYNYVVNGYVVSTFNVSITSLLSPTYIDDNTFEHPKNIGYDKAKQCALIAVNEIIENDKKNYGIDGFVVEYWQEVKQEIENL